MKRIPARLACMAAQGQRPGSMRKRTYGTDKSQSADAQQMKDHQHISCMFPRKKKLKDWNGFVFVSSAQETPVIYMPNLDVISYTLTPTSVLRYTCKTVSFFSANGLF